MRKCVILQAWKRSHGSSCKSQDSQEISGGIIHVERTLDNLWIYRYSNSLSNDSWGFLYMLRDVFHHQTAGFKRCCQTTPAVMAGKSHHAFTTSESIWILNLLAKVCFTNPCTSIIGILYNTNSVVFWVSGKKITPSNSTQTTAPSAWRALPAISLSSCSNSTSREKKCGKAMKFIGVISQLFGKKTLLPKKKSWFFCVVGLWILWLSYLLWKTTNFSILIEDSGVVLAQVSTVKHLRNPRG